jgi:malonate decarboxylase epsilon subunit
MGVAFLFPGQGSQVPGMLHVLPDHPEVARTIRAVSERLGEDVLTHDSAEALRSNVSVQLSLLAAGVGVARALIAERVEPAAVAGLSAGAYSAAVVAGVLDLADAVRLVKERAERMMELYPRGYGLAAVVGLNEKQVSSLVEAAFTDLDPVYVSNINAPRQIVIAGSDQGLNCVMQAALNQGARKAVRLEVSEPSHCPLLEPVANALRKKVQRLHLQPPNMIYVGNMTGRALRSAREIAEDFASNIAHAVRWYDSTSVLVELGCSLFLEMPPGHVLTVLGQAAFPEVRTIAVGETPLAYVVGLSKKLGNDLSVAG